MSIAMPDSIHVEDLPPGYPAYLGYVDGRYVTAPDLRKAFPAAHILELTVTGATLECDGVDSEKQDLTAAGAADWTARKLASSPRFQPVIYASVLGEPGYGMHDVLRELSIRSIPRSRVRLISAHYKWRTGGFAKHICGPGTCNLISPAMDGTQWADDYPGVSGHLIDMSVLRDDFFTATPDPQEDSVQLPGVPGIWLILHQLLDTQTQVEYVVGLGTSGRVYMTKRPPGGQWAVPVLI